MAKFLKIVCKIEIFWGFEDKFFEKKFKIQVICLNFSFLLREFWQKQSYKLTQRGCPLKKLDLLRKSFLSSQSVSLHFPLCFCCRHFLSALSRLTPWIPTPKPPPQGRGLSNVSMNFTQKFIENAWFKAKIQGFHTKIHKFA